MVRKAVVISRPGHATGWEEKIAQDYDGILTASTGTEISGVNCGELWWALTKVCLANACA
jgi:hypothetical protein